MLDAVYNMKYTYIPRGILSRNSFKPPPTTTFLPEIISV